MDPNVWLPIHKAQSYQQRSKLFLPLSISLEGNQLLQRSLKEEEHFHPMEFD